MSLRLTLSVLVLTTVVEITATGAGAAAGSQPVREPPFQEMASSANAHIRLYATVLKESVWLQADRVVFVCWENLASSNAPDAAKVQKAVTDTWQAESALKFRGWQACASKSRGIRIRVEDSGPHTKGLGRMLDGKPAGMVLNFTFKNWSQACQASRDYCVAGIAVHEFGHAIGFAHEQNRADAPGECRQLTQGTNGDLLLTPYDRTSVMNYCNQKYNNDGKLSALDSAAVKELYGVPSSTAN